MPRDFSTERFEDDFSDELTSEILIQNFIRNDGYRDVFSEGSTYPCHCQYETYNVVKSDGSISPTTMQIFLAADVVIGLKDKITVNGISPKIMRVSPDPDGYGLVVLT